MGMPENAILDTAGQDEIQIQAIGTVVTVYGTAGVRTQAGDLTQLEAGDPVFQDDLLATGEPGGLVVEFRDGSRLDLGRNSEAKLDEEVFDASLAEAPQEDVAAEDGELENLLQQLDLDELAPTAAGNAQGGQGDEGNGFVILDRSEQATDPESGVDSIGLALALGAPPQEESVLPVLVNGPAPSEAGENGGPATIEECFEHAFEALFSSGEEYDLQLIVSNLLDCIEEVGGFPADVA